jgi:hypothetical protein
MFNLGTRTSVKLPRPDLHAQKRHSLNRKGHAEVESAPNEESEIEQLLRKWTNVYEDDE